MFSFFSVTILYIFLVSVLFIFSTYISPFSASVLFSFFSASILFIFSDNVFSCISSMTWSFLMKFCLHEFSNSLRWYHEIQTSNFGCNTQNILATVPSGLLKLSSYSVKFLENLTTEMLDFSPSVYSVHGIFHVSESQFFFPLFYRLSVSSFEPECVTNRIGQLARLYIVDY